jgi:hypothetical protein
MKTKIVITTMKAEEKGLHRSEIWSGEMEILDNQEYLVLFSIIAEGQPQPIFQAPFAIGIGHYRWIPPDREWAAMYDNEEQDYGD